jgi:hypothetical protein
VKPPPKQRNPPKPKNTTHAAAAAPAALARVVTPQVNTGHVGGKTCCKSPRLENYYPDEKERAADQAMEQVKEKRKKKSARMVTPTNSDSIDEDSVDHGDQK